MSTKIVIALFAACMFGCSINTSPGNGEKIGTIVKLAKVGMFSQTWEAELIRGGLNGGSGSFGATPFHFTIETPELAAQAKKAMEEGREVLVRYRQEGIAAAIRSESGGIFAVTIIDAPRPAVR